MADSEPPPHSSDRPLPRFPLEEDETQIARFESPRTSRTSLAPMTISKPPNTSTTAETTTTAPSTSLDTPREKELDMKPESSGVVPTEPPPPPPPPKKSDDPIVVGRWRPWLSLLVWGGAALAIVGGLAWLVVRIVLR